MKKFRVRGYGFHGSWEARLVGEADGFILSDSQKRHLSKAMCPHSDCHCSPRMDCSNFEEASDVAAVTELILRGGDAVHVLVPILPGEDLYCDELLRERGWEIYWNSIYKQMSAVQSPFGAFNAFFGSFVAVEDLDLTYADPVHQKDLFTNEKMDNNGRTWYCFAQYSSGSSLWACGKEAAIAGHLHMSRQASRIYRRPVTN